MKELKKYNRLVKSSGSMEQAIEMAEAHPDRCTGKTTAAALANIAVAMRNPDVKIPIKFHEDAVTRERRRVFIQTIQDLIVRLGFTGFGVTEETIKFSPFGDVEVVTAVVYNVVK